MNAKNVLAKWARRTAGLVCGLAALSLSAQFPPTEPPVNPPSGPLSPPVFPVESTPDGLTPCICGPLVGNYLAGQIETWFVQADGGPLELRLTTVTVNTTDPQSTVVDVFDGGTLLTSVNVSYTAAEAAANGLGWEKFLDVSLGMQPAGRVLRIEARNGGTPMTQTHYWLKLCGARWLAIASPSFRALEEDHAAWRFRVNAGEPLVIDLDNTGIPTPAVDFAWHLIDPAGAVVGAGTNAIVAGPEFNLPTPAAGLWTLQMRPLRGEHYLLAKQSGADRFIYLDWHTSQRGRKVVQIGLDGVPARGVPFEVRMLRRHPAGGGFTNVLVATQVTTNGLADFKRLPNGYYDAVVRPLDPKIAPVPPQLDLILCDAPVTNRFVFVRGQTASVDFGGRIHEPAGNATVRQERGTLIVENLPSDGSGGVQIPVPADPERRWLKFDFAPVDLNHDGARLVFLETPPRGGQGANGGPARAAVETGTRRLVLEGSADRITLTNVLGEFIPATLTLGWHGTGGRGETNVPAGVTLALVGPTEVESFHTLVPRADNPRKLAGGGLMLTREAELRADGMPLGRVRQLSWWIALEGESAAGVGGATAVDIRATLPGGSFTIRGESESHPPLPPALRLERRADGTLSLDFQPEAGVDHYIEATGDAGLSWEPVGRRAGTFLPESVELPADREVRLFRVRLAP